MAFHKIDIENWDRKECFEHFMTVAKSTYSITVNMDVTELLKWTKEKDYRFYPAFTWIVSRALNLHKEFKMGYDEEQNLGYYDEIHPDYAVLDEQTKIMDSLCTPYQENFNDFYRHMVKDMEVFKNQGAHTAMRPDFFVASCLPWLSYSSFTASNESDYQFLFPMVTWGKYFEQSGRMLMPVTIQIHHAVADGYHCSLFYNEVEQVLKKPEVYMGYYQVTEVYPGVYRITSKEQVYMELFVGKEKALLLDTGWGYGNLKEVVKKITDLPLYIVNTHGHVDHTSANCQFDENIYIHPDDMAVCLEHNSPAYRKGSVEGAKHKVNQQTGEEENILPDDFDEETFLTAGTGKLVPLKEGDVFELGGITLEVILVPGHTRGSIGLLYREKRVFYSGDSMNSFFWIFLPESLHLRDYISTLNKAKKMDFEKLVMAHSSVIADKDILDIFLETAEKLDFEKGIPFHTDVVSGEVEVRNCFREGYTMEDIGAEGFACIAISREHL